MSGQRIAMDQQTFTVEERPEAGPGGRQPPEINPAQHTYVWMPLYMDSYGGKEIYVWAPTNMGKADILAELLRVFEEHAGHGR